MNDKQLNEEIKRKRAAKPPHVFRTEFKQSTEQFNSTYQHHNKSMQHLEKTFLRDIHHVQHKKIGRKEKRRQLERAMFSSLPGSPELNGIMTKYRHEAEKRKTLLSQDQQQQTRAASPRQRVRHKTKQHTFIATSWVDPMLGDVEEEKEKEKKQATHKKKKKKPSSSSPSPPTASSPQPMDLSAIDEGEHTPVKQFIFDNDLHLSPTNVRRRSFAYGDLSPVSSPSFRNSPTMSSSPNVNYHESIESPVVPSKKKKSSKHTTTSKRKKVSTPKRRVSIDFRAMSSSPNMQFNRALR